MQVTTLDQGRTISFDQLAAHYPTPEGAWVRTNLVTSLDGKVSFSGRSGGLSTPHDRAVFRYLRATSQVVLVGKGTATIEGYRDAPLDDQHRRLRATMGIDRPLEIVIATRRPTRSTRGPLREVNLDAIDGGTSLAALLGLDLAMPGGILLEGGPTLLAWMLARGLVDELCLSLRHMLVGSGELDLGTSAPVQGFSLAGLIATNDASFLRLLPEPTA